MLDEPLNELDMCYSNQLMQALRNLAYDRKNKVITVLYDINQKVIETTHTTDMLIWDIIEDLYEVETIVIEHKGYPVIINSRI